MIVNYDGFRLDEALSDAYFEMVSELQAKHYGTAVRYTTSSFMRMKLGAELTSRRGRSACLRVARGSRRLCGAPRREGLNAMSAVAGPPSTQPHPSARDVAVARRIDWAAIELDYRAGALSLREMAHKHGCSHSTIANFAGRHGWTRTAVVPGRPRSKTSKILCVVGGSVCVTGSGSWSTTRYCCTVSPEASLEKEPPCTA